MRDQNQQVTKAIQITSIKSPVISLFKKTAKRATETLELFGWNCTIEFEINNDTTLIDQQNSQPYSLFEIEL
jgi:hypothetical protein